MDTDTFDPEVAQRSMEQLNKPTARITQEEWDEVLGFVRKMTAIFEALGNNPMASMMLGGIDLSNG